MTRHEIVPFKESCVPRSAARPAGTLLGWPLTSTCYHKAVATVYDRRRGLELSAARRSPVPSHARSSQPSALSERLADR